MQTLYPVVVRKSGALKAELSICWLIFVPALAFSFGIPLGWLPGERILRFIQQGGIHWRDYTSYLAWKCLGLSQEDLDNMARERNIWAMFQAASWIRGGK